LHAWKIIDVRNWVDIVVKYQDCFLDDKQLKNYVFPFLCVDDPYESAREELLRSRWAEDNKILHGEFKPAKRERSLERVTKHQLPDIVNYIKKVIMVDWAEVNFIIGTNPENYIEVKFDQKSVDTELGLKAYMNTMISTHEVVSQFNLKRVLKFWGFKDGKHVYFMLAPAWIKFNPAHVYHTVINFGEDAKQTEGSPVGNRMSNMMSAVNFKEPQLYSKDIDI